MNEDILIPVQLNEYHNQGNMGENEAELLSSEELAGDSIIQSNCLSSTTQSFDQSNVSCLDQSLEANLAEKRKNEIIIIRKNALSILVLTLINLLNYIDRYSIAGVLDAIVDSYHINNREAGLIQTSFITSYMLLSPVFGYMGDRYKRKYIMAAGIGFWSLFTLASSFMEKYELFLFTRALVGIGEASYSTIAPTIIADLFIGTARTKALTLFYFAIPVGSGLGYIVGSKFAELFHNWRWALRLTPGLGLICTVLILLLVSEPRRGFAENSQSLEATSYLADLRYLARHKSFILSTAGFTCVAFVAGALALWAPSFISRSILSRPQDSNLADVSLIFGIITCFAGVVGVMMGSWSASKLRRYTEKADPFVCAFGLISSAPCLYFSLVLARYNTVITWMLILIGETLLCLNWAIITDMLLYIVIPTRRSTAEAIQILLSHILGDAGSPFLIGIINDAVVGSRQHNPVIDYVGLQYALFITSYVCVLGGAFFLATSLFIVSDRNAAQRIISGSRHVSGSGSSLASATNDSIPSEYCINDNSIADS